VPLTALATSDLSGRSLSAFLAESSAVYPERDVRSILHFSSSGNRCPPHPPEKERNCSPGRKTGYRYCRTHARRKRFRFTSGTNDVARFRYGDLPGPTTSLCSKLRASRHPCSTRSILILSLLGLLAVQTRNCPLPMATARGMCHGTR